MSSWRVEFGPKVWRYGTATVFEFHISALRFPPMGELSVDNCLHQKMLLPVQQSPKVSSASSPHFHHTIQVVQTEPGSIAKAQKGEIKNHF